MKLSSRVAVAVLGSAWMIGCAHKPVAVAPPPPAPVAQPTPPPPAPTRPTVNWAAVLQQAVLHFDFDRDDLKPESQAHLANLAPLLRANPTVRIQVAGNCDERGTEEYNLHLGERRANVAKKYLVDLGMRRRGRSIVGTISSRCVSRPGPQPKSGPSGLVSRRRGGRARQHRNDLGLNLRRT